MTEKPTTTSVSTASIGIMIRETFSMPLRTPPNMTAMVMAAKIRKQTTVAAGLPRKPSKAPSSAMVSPCPDR